MIQELQVGDFVVYIPDRIITKILGYDVEQGYRLDCGKSASRVDLRKATDQDWVQLMG